MALEAHIEQPSGVVATYWRIIKSTRDYELGTISIDIAGYASKEARKAGKAPITISQKVESLNETPETRNDIYPLIKTDAFENAIDC